MVNAHYFLTTEPWIDVVDLQGERQRVSLSEIFLHAHEYRRLAGEMQSQDLAMMRLLLAILHTVYSRFDVAGDTYDWLEIDPNTMQVDTVTDPYDFDSDELFATWQQLETQGQFSQVVQDYLQTYKQQFDFLGETPFYQVSQGVYDRFVPANKWVATGTGTVAIKQINRRISESGNSPAIFAPKTASSKDKLTLSELVRWVITYQNYTGVTDKTKVETSEKFSTNAGWLYRLNPVFAYGDNLFETLMLNLVLVDTEHPDTYVVQHPVWEYADVVDYIQSRKAGVQPDNVAAIYTAWSRMLHIEWLNETPTIFSAALPMFPADGLFVEPMTTWRVDRKTSQYQPATKQRRRLDEAMWRHFGQYVVVNQEDGQHEPGVVAWLQTLKQRRLLDRNRLLRLMSVALVSDGNATSQSPIAEVVDDMAINAEVLFDEDMKQRWPIRIEGAIKLAQSIGSVYSRFAKDVGEIRGYQGSEFADREVAKYYAQLNGPFKQWLQGLSGDDDREEKLGEWRQVLRRLTKRCVDNFMQTITPQDIRGLPPKKLPNGTIRPEQNIFIATNSFWARVNTLFKKG